MTLHVRPARPSTFLPALAFAAVLAAGCAHPDPARYEAIPDDVRESVDAAVDRGHRVGVVVGLVNPQGRHFHASGTTEAEGDVPMTPSTVMGIGSLTKLFTARLLTDAIADGQVTLDTPVASLLPVDDSADTRLLHLATHRADLPRSLPAEALQQDDPALLFAILADPRSVPAEPAYSNVGYAVLGQTLAAAAGAPLPELVERRITTPMQLPSTGYDPAPADRATPHQGRTPVAPPTVPAFARGAGGLYSSAEDLLTFVEQHLAPAGDEQDARLALLTGSGVPGGEPLGWKRHREDGLEVFHHGGDGNGYQAFMAFRPSNGTGVVLLTNSSADDALQQVAHHLLDPGVPLPDFDGAPALLLTPQQLAPYAGRYRILGDANTVELTVADDGLHYIERDGEGELVRESRLFALSPDRFELREIPVTVAFEGPDRATLKAGEQVFVMERM